MSCNVISGVLLFLSVHAVNDRTMDDSKSRNAGHIHNDDSGDQCNAVASSHQDFKGGDFPTGIAFMNCAELHLNSNNIGNYAGEPMYMTRHGYLSPIWSHELTCRLMRECAEEKWPIVIHDCCNMTKFARDLNVKVHEGGWFGASAYHTEFDGIPYAAFLPTLEDPNFAFVEEDELPYSYRPGDIVL